MKIRFPIYILYFIIIMMIFSSGASSKVDNIEFEVVVDTAYLPYKSIEARDYQVAQDCSYPENNLIEIITPAIANNQDGLLILSNNPSPNSGASSMFTPRTFPDFEVTDDDPIPYVITNWKTFSDKHDSSAIIVGVCHNDDSVFVFKLYVDTDSIEYNNIYSLESGSDHELVPFAHILFAGDIDRDGSNEILLYFYSQRIVRRLICLDYKSLQVKWAREVSSGINPNSFQVLEDTLKPRILFSTGNSANGMKDLEYNDYYSYLTILDKNGEFIVNEITGFYGHKASEIIKSDIVGEYYITHYLDYESADSIVSNNEDKYYLSRMNSSGVRLKSITIEGTPINMWLMNYGETDDLMLFVRLATKGLSVYDLDLNLRYTSKPLEVTMRYLGRYKIIGQNDSVYVFPDGLYDKDLRKVLQFPFVCGKFLPMEYDSTGNLTAYIITEYFHYYIGYIEKKSSYELATVFYHQNQSYVLMALSGLLVGLIIVNFYRSRTKKNLSVISSQKKELEMTHSALRKAQATILAQEKFRQAKDIAGGFAHEIRNALFPAQSALSRLKSIPQEGMTNHKRISDLTVFSNDAIVRAINLTKLITEYTKIEHGKGIESVNVSKILDEAIESNKLRIEKQNALVKINGSNKAEITASERHLYIIFNNLLLNALDAVMNADKPLISVEWVYSSGYTTIVFSDNGKGIEGSEIKRIFDVFYSTKPDSGTGLGLSMVKKVIELYDGKIQVFSTPNEKTSFSVKLVSKNSY